MRILIYDTTIPNAFVTGAGYLSRKGIEIILLTEKQLLPYQGSIYDYLSPLIQHSIRKTLHTIKPSIIHIHAIRTPIAIWLFSVACQLRIPVVATLHSYKFLCPITHYVERPEFVPCTKPYPNSKCSKCVKCKAVQEHSFSTIAYKAYMSLIRRAYRQANVLIAISQELYRLFKIIGYDNVVYLPNPVEIPDLNFPKEIRESGRVNIGFFGQLKDYKGVQVLPLIAKRLPDVNFHVAGWGPLRDWLIKESAKYSNLIFHGYLSRDHLLSYIESLDAVLVPSICNEACPGAVLEAFAQRKPVVCFDLGGQAELVRLAKGGLLAKPFSVDDLCDKVEILISDPIKQAEFGLNGRKWVEQNCSPERHSEALINIYESLSATHSESMSH